MPTNQNYDPRSGGAGGNYRPPGRQSSGGFGSQSGGLGSTGFGGGSGFGSGGSMGSGAGSNRTPQSHGGTFGTGGLMGTGFNTRTVGNGTTYDPYFGSGGQQQFGVLEGSSGTPGGSPYGGFGNTAAAGFGGVGGGYYDGTSGYGPAYEQAMQSTYTAGGGYGGYGNDPTQSAEYASTMTAAGESGGSPSGSPQNLMEYINQYRAGVGASAVDGSASTVEEAQELIRQNDLARQYEQNQSYIDTLQPDQAANERTAQSLGYLSYQAYLNANPGQTMPGAQGIPGQESADPGNTGVQQSGYQPGAPYQPSNGYQPGYNPGGYYDPRTQTAYTGGFGGGPAQQPSPPQRAYMPGATSGGLSPGQQNPYGHPYQTPGMFDAYNQQNGISSQPQGGANGYIVPGTGHPGENGPGGDIGPIKPPGPGDRVDPPDYEGALNGTNPSKGQIGKPRGSSPPNGKTMPVLKRNGTGSGSDGKARQTVNPFETYDDGPESGKAGGRMFDRNGNGTPDALENVYGGQNSPMATHGQTGEQIMAPGMGGMPQAMTMTPGATPEQMAQANESWRRIQEGAHNGGGQQANPWNNQGQPPGPPSGGPHPPWMGPNPTQPYPEGNMTPGSNPWDNQGQPPGPPVEFNPFGAVERPEMTYPGGGQPVPSGGPQWSNHPVDEYATSAGGGFNPFGAVERPEMTYPGGGQRNDPRTHEELMGRTQEQAYQEAMNRGPHNMGGQTYEGGIDMNWLGQDGRFLGGGTPLYGGQNSPQATHGQTGEQIMAPGSGGNPFGAVSRPPMSYPGGGQPQPSGGGWGQSEPTQNPFETYEGPMMHGQGGGPQVMGDLSVEGAQRLRQQGLSTHGGYGPNGNYWMY